MTYAAEERSPPWGQLPPGQVTILRSFRKHGATSVYVPSDIMDMRVCGAMAEKGIVQRFEHEGEFVGYELTPMGVRAMEATR